MSKAKKGNNASARMMNIGRREFVKLSGITAIGITTFGFSELSDRNVAIILNRNDSIAGSSQVLWATGELEAALSDAGISVNRFDKLEQSEPNSTNIVIAGSESVEAGTLLKNSGIEIPSEPEALGLIPLNSGGKQILLACGYDLRGIVYAVLELTDRVRYSTSTDEEFQLINPLIEKPANKIRSVQRLFVSEVEDKPWFYDKEMWNQYLTMLATQRFNRFNLSLGIGYDWLENVLDAYFLFTYPFLISVPGYNVRVLGLSDNERDRNLEMLRYISDQAAARGMQFQLGLWMHGHDWVRSPNPNYTIAGITPENHGPYCRDAVRSLLKACPSISGITFRIHAEAGVSEGSYDFWRTVFEGVETCGREVNIDMHAKGIDQEMIDKALDTGMPVTASPKYWAEHIGLPYQQADIRPQEIPPEENRSDLVADTGVSTSLSSGSRKFMRYGYGDLLKEDRKYGVLYRIWPGTQRILMWGDPVTAAGHSRAFSFCGCDGVELMEPLSFKGRRGSGMPGGRCGYADTLLKPRWDWQKYLYTYRVFGRKLYNPETTVDVWQRYLKSQFGAGAAATESALAYATRILPIVLTAHGTSAGNNTYWPELYTNQPIVISDDNDYSFLYDTPSPKVFGNVTPMDPQLFLGINDFVKEILSANRSGKYTPVEYAQWIEDYATEAEEYLKKAQSETININRPEFRRIAIDVAMLAGLGWFFGTKFRAGVLFTIYKDTGNRTALEKAISTYQKARDYWVGVADIAKDVYVSDLTIGEERWLRGHWTDRIPAIDEDIEKMRLKLESAKNDNSPDENTEKAISEALGRPQRTTVHCSHNQPESLNWGESLDLEFSFEEKPAGAKLYYRHVSQAERYKEMELTWQRNTGKATIPAGYLDSSYPLAYYIEVRYNSGVPSLFPGFDENQANRPYFVVSHPNSMV